MCVPTACTIVWRGAHRLGRAPHSLRANHTNNFVAEHADCDDDDDDSYYSAAGKSRINDVNSSRYDVHTDISATTQFEMQLHVSGGDVNVTASTGIQVSVQSDRHNRGFYL